MITKLATVAVVAVLSLSPPLPQDQAQEIALLKRQVQELRDQQAQMQRELTAIKTFLQSIMEQARGKGAAQEPEVPGLVGASVPTAGEPVMGSASAKVTIMEVSDYQCPFCKRQVLQTFPQIDAEYIKTGKVQYMFVDYPIAQLHPTAARSHEAANCAGEQGKYWQMHVSLFTSPIAKDDAALVAQAKSVGLDAARLQSCLASGKYAESVQASVRRMEQLGIAGTPMVLIGLTPPPGQPMKIVKFVYGAQSFQAFKAAIDSVLGS
ncbi:thioredoxin domain-containing protein [soil metagenome]